ncbi:cysteine desulfurase family protein [Nocardia abscessus]|uniref:cysteine desulfurase family protein n=1 Tax=Nocardia abscessus TaxID=120957 RepID=UPI0024583D9E|nr:aminotransferase class V-fold PLP-dependent enzyme [Nocardia abscessus]
MPQTCQALARLHGVRVTVLPVGADGRLDPATLAAALRDSEATLVSVMAADNETGVLQPIRELAALAHRHGALFHCDAAQATGKIPLDVAALGVDLLTVVGHKMYAPKGIGALCIRSGVELEPVVCGGGQEHGLRASTENVATGTNSSPPHPTSPPPPAPPTTAAPTPHPPYSRQWESSSHGR